MSKILIVEDEKDLANILGAYLEVEGYQVFVADDGAAGLHLFQKETIDLVLLDIMLPKLDGIQVCKIIRGHSDIPIIMISAKSGEMDKVIALGIGADDYVTKPFSPLELVARVKAQLRRFQKSVYSIQAGKDLIQIGELILNKAAYTVTVKDSPIDFTTKEFEVLYFLCEHPNQVFSKIQIYEGVWGYQGVPDDNSVTVYINRIREKLNQKGIESIKTVWGAGYKCVV